MFFWFNAAVVAAIAVSNALLDDLGGHWVILPLIWVAGFVGKKYVGRYVGDRFRRESRNPVRYVRV
jgi:divalent metal cation (Fe/Co/Zn/Cd) transporter